MEHLVDQELAGWSHSKSWGQWLHVQVQSSDEQHPQGLGLGLVLFNIFVGDMGSGMEAPSACLPTTLEGRIHPEGPGQAGEGRWANLMEFNKAKCKVLPMGWSNPKHKSRLGGEGLSRITRSLWFVPGSSQVPERRIYKGA